MRGFRGGEGRDHKKSEKKRRTGSTERGRRKMTGYEFPVSGRHKRCLCEIEMRICRD